MPPRRRSTWIAPQRARLLRIATNHLTSPDPARDCNVVDAGLALLTELLDHGFYPPSLDR
jgi:hypothetical protein